MSDRAARPVRSRSRSLAALGVALFFAAAAPLAAQEAPPTPGERVRIDILSQTAYAMGLEPDFEGTFIMMREDALVASNSYNGGIALPIASVQKLRVRRPRPASHALVRGAIAGGAFGLAAYPFLRLLCRGACSGGMTSAWFPAVSTGFGVGLLVASAGPGSHWVETPMPAPEPAGGGFTLSLPVPTPGR